MKKFLTITILFLFTLLANAQDNGLKSKLVDENFSRSNISTQQFDSIYLELQPIQTTKYKSHFRISILGQKIDLYSLDNITYQGILTNYTTEYISVKNKDNDYNQSKENQYIFEKIVLEQSKVENIVNKLIQTGLPKIPTDTLISSWQHNFLHCNGLSFEFNINGNYTKQTYQCPWWQNDSTQFKSTILENYQNLKSIFLLDTLYSNFENKLPKGKTYSRDGYRMMYKMTDEQTESWKKTQPKRDFMKSVKDTIDSYIKSELEKQNIQLKEINCFEDYRLIIGKNGKLKKVYLSNYNKPSLKKSLGFRDYLDDKREIRKCKRKITQIFSYIDLKFLKLETEIYRTLSFGLNNEIQYRDDTIY